jgi:hypothetical protein
MRIRRVRYEYAFPLRGWKESTGLAGFVYCTLLGPEGPERNMKVFRTVPLDLLLLAEPFGGRQGGYRPYFENYTVDASILDLNTFVFKSH